MLLSAIAHYASVTAGTLRLARSDATLHFAKRANGRSDFEEIGTIEFGSKPIYNLEFWVFVPQTDSPVEVILDNVLVEADRIVGPPSPADSIFGPAAWISTVGVLLVAGILWLWYWRVRSVPKEHITFMPILVAALISLG